MAGVDCADLPLAPGENLNGLLEQTSPYLSKFDSDSFGSPFGLSSEGE